MWFYLVLGLFILAYYVLKTKNDYWEKRGVPTASGNEWFFGHLRPVVFLKKHIIELLEDMYKEFPDAPLVGYYAMNVPTLMVKDLDIIKTILVSEFSSFSHNGKMFDKKVDPLAAVHPFFLKGEEWKASRAQVIPSLTSTRLKGYLPNILKVGDEMVKYVKKNCNGTVELETRKLSLTYSTDVVGNAVYGIENNTFENKDSLISHLAKEIQFETYLSDSIKQIFKQLPIIRWFFPARLVSQKLQDVMVAVTRKVIKERQATGEKRNDLIQLLLAQKENDTRGVYTDEYMAGQVFIFIIDLYETGSNAISAILFLLAVHSNVQEKLRSEIQEIKSKKNGDLTIEDIEGAKYLDMVFNETFRFFSFFLNRECTSDCYIPIPGSDPFKITKGTSVLIPVTSIQKDPKYYPDPKKFDPKRFSAEEVTKRPKFSFMPFGEGPKKCIGARLVTLHIKIAIIKLIENFKLTPSTKTKYPFETDPHYTLTIRPKGGAWVIFEPISK